MHNQDNGPGRLFGRALAALFAFAMVALATPAPAPAADGGALPDEVSFNRDIRPVLSENCYACHGFDKAKRKADLRLDTKEGGYAELEEGGHPLVAGEPEKSHVFVRITTDDEDDVMPPRKSGKKLTARQVALIKKWIEQGAEYQPHWSYIRPERPAVPEVETDAGLLLGQVDALIQAKLRETELAPSGEADRATLIRRLSFDLTGLPPDPDNVDAFIADARPDAYERLVDQLLASPRYGERWGRHWLDVVHFGESHGYDKDKPRPNAWPYRDYVIRSLNADKPYSRFVKEQLAGDVLYPGTSDGIVATGFIAAGPWDFVGRVELREGTSDKELTRSNDRDDIVMTTMSTFQSLTVHCARCHNHKFDPITQEDYYKQLLALFSRGYIQVTTGEQEADESALIVRLLWIKS